ncbi:MAG: hypothetical protein RLZZ342_287 [Candidatus Parcubacteria bacterium]
MNSRQALPFWLLLVLALAWTFLSLDWYVCGIKGFCGAPRHPQVFLMQERPARTAWGREHMRRDCLHTQRESFNYYINDL